MSRTTSSHQAQLVATALVSGIVVAGAVLGFQTARRKFKVARVKADIPDISQEHVATRVRLATQQDSPAIDEPITLTDEVKLTEYGAASDVFAPSKEDERSAALALRARQGDYDDGNVMGHQFHAFSGGMGLTVRIQISSSNSSLATASSLPMRA